MFKRIAVALLVLISLPFVALAAAVGYLLFAEWRERMRNPPHDRCLNLLPRRGNNRAAPLPRHNPLLGSSDALTNRVAASPVASTTCWSPE
jgi:hypothetical protein